MQRSLFLAKLLSLTLIGCGGATDREENIPSWGGGEGDDGAQPGDDGDDPDPGDDGGATPDVGDGDDPGDDGGTDEPPPDDGGTDEGTDDPGDGADPDDPADEEPPDCNPYMALWPSKGSAEPPRTREELWCYVNGSRLAYVEHGRSNGPIDEEGDGSVTWPYTMAWDKDLADSAQVEAERVASGGSPTGTFVSGWGAKDLWISGNNTADYMLTTIDDYVTDWWDPSPCCHDPTIPSGMSTNNGAARLGLYYHDYSGAGPVLTTMGTGMAGDADGARVLVVRLAP